MYKHFMFDRTAQVIEIESGNSQCFLPFAKQYHVQ